MPDEEDPIRSSVRRIEGDLGLSPGFLESLRDEDDWSFVIKVHAIFEAAVAHLLLTVLKRDELAEVLSFLELSDKRRGKMAFAAALDLIEKADRRFISSLARVAASAFELERSPILGFRDLKIEVVSTVPEQADAPNGGQARMSSIRVGAELFNAGRVPLKYRMRSFSVTFAGRATDTAQFMSRGGRVLPGASTVFWHPSLILEPAVTEFPAKGRVRFEFEYSDESGSNRQIIIDTVEYAIDGAKPGSHVSWLYVDEPSAQ